MTRDLHTPLTRQEVERLQLYDHVTLSGFILTGRDIVLPKLVTLAESGGLSPDEFDLAGSVIFHSAVSPAGLGPTSSNKLEIEGSMVPLSRLGVRLHIGKGALSRETLEAMAHYGSAYALVPPVSALLASKVLSSRVLLFPEDGMEALHLLEVVDFPAIIAGVKGQSIFA